LKTGAAICRSPHRQPFAPLPGDARYPPVAFQEEFSGKLPAEPDIRDTAKDVVRAAKLYLVSPASGTY